MRKICRLAADLWRLLLRRWLGLHHRLTEAEADQVVTHVEAVGPWFEETAMTTYATALASLVQHGLTAQQAANVGTVILSAGRIEGVYVGEQLAAQPGFGLGGLDQVVGLADLIQVLAEGVLDDPKPGA